MGFEERVSQVLMAAFPGAAVDVAFGGAERLSGHLVWNGFERKAQMTRQRLVHRVLRKALGPDAQRISIILTYTPREYDLMATA